MPTKSDATARSTNWDAYYSRVPFTAKVTRRYTTAVLLKAIRQQAQRVSAPLSILELGGANSCFVDSILQGVQCRSYEVVDTNDYGLSLLAQRCDSRIVRLRNQNVLSLSVEEPADVVFSVGLVEHFDQAGTRRAVEAHFDALKPGGIAIVTFPTPTGLYRATRRLLEMAGLWKFHDERPLEPAEVLGAIDGHGTVVHQQMMWPLVLTQYLIVARKG